MGSMDSFDLIIIGAGAAGLFLADNLCSDPYFDKHRILLLEKDKKDNNDRTWCFWEKGEGELEPLVYASWNKIRFRGDTMQKVSEINPYRYKMIRGADFYKFYLDKLQACPNLTYLQAEVCEVKETASGISVTTDNETFTARQVFSSIYDPRSPYQQKSYPVLQQHFLGWRVRTENPVFKPDEATFMDFSVLQKGNTRFMYVLPFSEREALVEYTLFSAEHLPRAAYEEALVEYLDSIGAGTYEIEETEYGSIPMTCYPFPGDDRSNMHKIGIAGGWAKPSTGYTFYNSFRKSRELAAQIKSGMVVRKVPKKDRFWWYDLWMLDYLWKYNGRGHELFTSLFTKRDTRLILKFLDEETTLSEELMIISACPKRRLAGMAFRRLFKWSAPSVKSRTA